MQKILNIVKVIFPFILGIFLIFYVYRSLTPKDIQEIKASIFQANYFWILVSISLGALSHWIRALRWRITLQSVGVNFDKFTAFYSVMIGYLINLVLPRAGEVSRAVYYARYRQAPFDKTFGTILAERILDTIILLTLIVTIFFLEYEKIGGIILQSPLGTLFNSPLQTIILSLLLLVLVFTFFWFIKYSQSKIAEKLRSFLSGFLDGIAGILYIPQKGLFLFYTLLIWFLYYAMFHVAIWCLPGTSGAPIMGILTAFIVGGLSIAVTNGGIGAFPLGIREILFLYGVNVNIGYAFGWIIWTAQTLMIVILGVISLILIKKDKRYA